MQWLAIYITTFTLCYFPGALRFESFLTTHLMVVAVFFALAQHLNRQEKETSTKLQVEPQQKLVTRFPSHAV
ncbi:MAG: hypothetical protein HC904_02650 [Blastochloris sp.]|nr:hypothetical protein [Blastochloris sp.]